MKKLFVLVALSVSLGAVGQISTRDRGNWNAATTWDCDCIPGLEDQIVIRHMVTIDPTLGDITVGAITVDNSTTESGTEDAEIIITGGVRLEVLGAIEVISNNESSGGDDVYFRISGDGTTVSCESFLLRRGNSSANTELLFRMTDNSSLEVIRDFVIEYLDNTSTENNVDFQMASDLPGNDTESPYLYIGGDFIVHVNKGGPSSNFALHIREQAVVEVGGNMQIIMENSPGDSDVYLYMSDAASRLSPGTNDLSITYSKLKIHGDLILEIPGVHGTDHPDIRCDIRGNASLEVENVVLAYRNGAGRTIANGAQDIDIILYDNASLTINNSLTLESELNSPNTPTLSNTLLQLNGNSRVDIKGDIFMFAELEDRESRIWVSENASLRIGGNINRKDSPLTMGRLQVSDNSTIVMGGSSKQTIPWVFGHTYQNLTIDNSSGEVLDLEGDVRIAQYLDMQNGVVESVFSPDSHNADDKYVVDFLTTASANLGNANSFITGVVRVTDRNASGSALHLPLGKVSPSGNKWGPITVNDFDVAVNPTFYIEYMPGEPIMSGAMVSPLERLTGHEYWALGRNSGGAYLSGEIFSTAQFTIYWQDACAYGIEEAESILGAWLDNNNTIGNIADDVWRSGTGTVVFGDACLSEAKTSSTSGQVTFAFSNSGSFRARGITIATSNAGMNPLPVSLREFKAEAYGQDRVKLIWVTESELNSDLFIVEKSVNGTEFTQVGQVLGAGTSSATHSYELIDAMPANGINYYRLRQVDTDGYEEVFPVIFYNHTSIAVSGIKVYPNPVGRDGMANVFLPEWNTCADISNIRIYSITGMDVTRQCRVILDQSQGILLDLNMLPSGFYTLSYQDNCGGAFRTKVAR
jgi:hypothetical protein